MGVSWTRRPTGHVFRAERVRGPVWFAKYRLPDGRQVQRKIGPAWTERGRPAAGYFTKRTAEEWLSTVLDQARKGTLPGLVQTGATFADAVDEWLRYSEHERAVKKSTLDGYNAMARKLKRDLGDRRLEDISTGLLEEWRAAAFADGASNRNAQKYTIALSGIFKRAVRVYGLPINPVTTLERPRVRKRAGIDVYSREEVFELVRAAESEQDAAIFLCAAFTGMRQGELLGLRWGEVDFSGQIIRVTRSYTHGRVDTPKSGKGRAVPMMFDVAEVLARLGQRKEFTGDSDLVFCGPEGGHIDPTRLSKRYKAAQAAAGLRPLRFHDLRHTFGTHAIRVADPRELMEWMGHADITTTQIYLAYKPRADAAERLSTAFAAPVESAKRD